MVLVPWHIHPTTQHFEDYWEDYDERLSFSEFEISMSKQRERQL
jgi:hypothetical protein